MKPPRRSVFADRLSEYSEFAFGDDAVFAQRGRWADYFYERIKTNFEGRIVFEVGTADGDLLCRLAAKHPSVAFIGLDWKAKSIFTAAERAAAIGLQNIALLRGRGQEIERIFGPGEINEILLFHPDPCALPAERPNRLFNPPFLIDAHRVLRAGGALTLKTDHAGYYGWALAVLGIDEPASFTAARERVAADPSLMKMLAGQPRLRAADLLPLSDRPSANAAVVARFDVARRSADLINDSAAQLHVADRVFAGEHTFFEKRFLRKSQPIYYLELRKRR